MPIVLIATMMIASTLMASANQRTVNRENALAVTATRDVFERMRNEDFTQVFALYNEDPFDDPAGPGTAPGKWFDIDGFMPSPAAPNGRVAEIVFPVLNTGGAVDPNWELREDLVSDVLGMPRDLNGDSVVDDLDHGNDYRLLPIVIVTRWESRLGPREFRMQTLLANWNWQS